MPNWSMAPVVAAYQALRGVPFIVAVTFVAEIGDTRRFDNPSQLRGFLGLIPSEWPMCDIVKRGGLTLSGNRRAHRALVEAPGSYCHPARMTDSIRTLEDLPEMVRGIRIKGSALVIGA